jgi:hypothetical protein
MLTGSGLARSWSKERNSLRTRFCTRDANLWLSGGLRPLGDAAPVSNASCSRRTMLLSILLIPLHGGPVASFALARQPSATPELALTHLLCCSFSTANNASRVRRFLSPRARPRSPALRMGTNDQLICLEDVRSRFDDSGPPSNALPWSSSGAPPTQHGPPDIQLAVPDAKLHSARLQVQPSSSCHLLLDTFLGALSSSLPGMNLLWAPPTVR